MGLTKNQLDAYIQGLYDDDGNLSPEDYQKIINYIISNGEPALNERDLIQIRRGDFADLPTLAQAELAYTLDTKELFIGGLEGNISLSNRDKWLSYTNVADKTTAQIQSVIDESAGNGVVYFGNTATNIYTLTDTLLLPSYTKIVIENGVTLKLDNAVNKPIFKNSSPLAGNTNISITGGRFDMNVTNQTAQTPCIRFDKLTKSTFENLVITGTKFVSYMNEGAFHFVDSSYINIKNCEIFNSGDESLLIVGTSSHFIVDGGKYYNAINGGGVACDGSYHIIKNVECSNCVGSNFSINSTHTILENCQSLNSVGNNAITLGHTGRPADYSIVRGCIVDTALEGIRVLGGSVGVVIANNVIKNITAPSSIGIGVSDTSKRCTITGNRIYSSGYGIYVTGNTHNIVGNVCENNRNDGIYVENSSWTTIAGNSCYDNGNYGIHIRSTGTYLVITGNNASDTRTTPLQQRGIYLDGFNCTITGNVAIRNVVAQISAGGSHILAGNMIN